MRGRGRVDLARKAFPVKAVVIKEYGGPEVLKVAESPMPEAGPGEILVKVRAAGLNRADLLQRSGLYPQPGPKHDAEIPGLEFAGEVAALNCKPLTAVALQGLLAPRLKPP